MEETEADRVRKRPGMYLGGVDEECLHKLADEILSNSMDEAVEGHATAIDITLRNDGSLQISDNGRGIPVDIHPRYDQSALEVIFTQFRPRPFDEQKIRAHTGPVITINAQVVNALSDWLWVEVVRQNEIYRTSFVRGKQVEKLKQIGSSKDRRGTTICFHPDPEIFREATFKPDALYAMARSKAHSYGGVEINWKCEPAVSDGETPNEDKFHFPNKF